MIFHSKFSLVSVFVLLLSSIFAAEEDPKGGGGDPPPCCPTGSTKVSTCTYTSDDGKGNSTTITVGEKSEVKIFHGGNDITGSGVCIEKGQTLILTMSGGDDSDVCKNDETGSCSPYGVPSNFVWIGPGTQDPSNPKKFTVDTSEVDSFTITAKSLEGNGDCNVGSETESASTTIKVWYVSEILPLPNVSSPPGNPNTSELLRGQNHEWEIDAEGLPQEYLWTSTATNETETDDDWSGWQAVDYNLSVTVTLECPFGSTIPPIIRYRNVDIVKGRTFNCAPENSPKRYPVSSSYPGTQSLSIPLACPGVHGGSTWNYPFPAGFGQATYMKNDIDVDEITYGPNQGVFYIKDFDNVDYKIDTNTGRIFTDSSTDWYINHSTSGYVGPSIYTLHSVTKTHEEGHYSLLSQGEFKMIGQNGFPEDMYDRCEDITGTSINAVRNAAETRMESAISWIKQDHASTVFSTHHHHYINPNDPNDPGLCGHYFTNGGSCDYYAFFRCPGWLNCAPGNACGPTLSTPCP